MNYIPLTSLIIPEERQRKEFDPGAIGELAESIEAQGLLQAPVIEISPLGPSLIAGERRCRAMALLIAQGKRIRHGGITCDPGAIPVLPLSDLSPLDRFDVELEENVRRVDLSWQEKAAAYARRAQLLSEARPDLPRSEVVRETRAAMAAVLPEEVKVLQASHLTILVGQNLSDPEIAKAKSEKDAVKILTRKLQKAEDARVTTSLPNTHLGDVFEVLPTLPSGHFDLILTDPPYGIEITQFSTQVSSEQKYEDSFEYWKELMPFCFKEWARVLKPNAHGYVFCDFSRFDQLCDLARLSGFEPYSRPLIWDRSPDGRLPTPEKWPRRVYECILYFRRGNRDLKVVRGDVLSYPADRDSANYHGAKKPVALLVDLLERSTHVGDKFLDCFGGSGASLRAGLTAAREPTIIERDTAYFGLMQTLASKQEGL